MAIVKTLKAARPTVSSETGKVANWDIEVTLADSGFERDYSYSADVFSADKAPNEFTREQLLALAPAVLDEVFAHHKQVSEGSYVPPTTTDNEFSLDSLASGGARN